MNVDVTGWADPENIVRIVRATPPLWENVVTDELLWIGIVVYNALAVLTYVVTHCAPTDGWSRK